MDPELTQTLDAIQRTLAALDARVAALEASLGGSAQAVVPPAEPTVAAAPPQVSAPATPEPDAIAPDILIAISAAVAAFLGERAHVRQIRLISSPAWGQQGRVNVQASHTLYR